MYLIILLLTTTKIITNCALQISQCTNIYGK